MKSIVLVCLFIAAPAIGLSADLQQDTLNSFERYMKIQDQQMARRASGSLPFLWVESKPDRLRRVRNGELLVEHVKEGDDFDVPDGLIQHWVGSVFIPGVTVRQTLDFIQRYDNHKNVYQPEVLDSRLLEHDGNHFRIFLRLLKKKVITVVLDTEHDVTFHQLGPGKWYSRSYTTKVHEVKDAGDSDEARLPAGTGYGFLWKMDAFWRFQESDGGVYLEIETISLSRSIPRALYWMISPIVKSLPEEAMTQTLGATRSGVRARAGLAR